MKIKDAKQSLVNTYTKKYGFPEAEIERLLLNCTEEEVLHQIESLNLIENEDNREQPQKKFKLFFPKGIK